MPQDLINDTKQKSQDISTPDVPNIQLPRVSPQESAQPRFTSSNEFTSAPVSSSPSVNPSSPVSEALGVPSNQPEGFLGEQLGNLQQEVPQLGEQPNFLDEFQQAEQLPNYGDLYVGQSQALRDLRNSPVERIINEAGAQLLQSPTTFNDSELDSNAKSNARRLFLNLWPRQIQSIGFRL